MLDADPASLVTIGTVSLSADRILIEGFDGDNCSCRDVAALAIVWAIGQLQKELQATLEAPGGGKASVD